MDNKSRGRALLINMEKFDDALQLETRLGSSADLDRLEKICKEKLMFEAPVVLRSPTKAEIFAEIDKSQLSQSFPEFSTKFFLFTVELENHADNDCLLVVMMTHGGENGILAAYDTHFRAFELWEGFMGKECKSLTGKPKLFILQACRGDPKHVDTGVRYRVVADARGSSEKVLSVPSSADQLILYATSEGNYSMRCEGSGSWLIQILCNQLEKNNKDDFLSILTEVNRKVALRIVGSEQTEARADARRLNLTGAKQCPVVVHTLTKKLFFSNSA